VTKAIAAVLQMTSAPEVEANLASARTLLERARVEGATLAVLPENFAIMGQRDADKVEVAEMPGEGPIQAFLGHCARELGLWIIGGTIPLRVDGQPERVSAASMMFDERGRCVGRYDKIHLFDVDIPQRDESYRESATVAPGNNATVVSTPLGRVGMAVCYDVRFPELFRVLRSRGRKSLACLQRLPPPRVRLIGNCCCGPGQSRICVTYWPRLKAASIRTGGRPGETR
jgi:predicted amidohydrolase